ncbi:hypothetical protein ADL03_27585 [Nocardia sp. NRRL S-836]|nr:hypothetical protein ADL03_27585 [Nocardia sp. NRRL S-836]
MQFWDKGELAVGRIDVGSRPGPDANRAGNQAALNVLSEFDADYPDDPPGFSAFVDPDQRLDPYGDGSFRWSGEIQLGIGVPNRPQAAAWAHIGPLGEGMTVPLEIGHTDTQTTYMHLVQGIGLARWAYGSEEIVLLVPSTFVREASLADDPAVRWKPDPMQRPFGAFVRMLTAADSPKPADQQEPDRG